jgi:hypothetical protein
VFSEVTRTARHWGLTSVILATQEADIRRIMVQSQSTTTKQKLKEKGKGLLWKDK